MYKKVGILVMACLLLFHLSACHMQFAVPDVSSDPGSGADPGGAPGGVTDPLALAATASETPRPTFTWTPERVTISVSLETNCRSGPGTAYDYLGGLMVGETTEVLGRDASGQFWVVRNPDVPGGICWLWDQYATVTGNWQSLPVATPPPTPSPTFTPVPPPDFTVTLAETVCHAANLRITNTGPVTWESWQTSGPDVHVVAEGTFVKISAGCGGGVEDARASIAPGESGHVYAGPLPGTHGDVTVTVKICSEDHLGGTCITKTIGVSY